MKKDVDVKCGANDKNDEETIRCYEEHKTNQSTSILAICMGERRIK